MSSENLVCCHFFMAFLLVEIKSVIFVGKECIEELFLRTWGVEVQAAFWTLVLKCSSAAIMLSSVLRITFVSIKSSTRFWKSIQSVFWGSFLFISLSRCKIIGEWSVGRCQTLAYKKNQWDQGFCWYLLANK